MTGDNYSNKAGHIIIFLCLSETLSIAMSHVPFVQLGTKVQTGNSVQTTQTAFEGPQEPIKVLMIHFSRGILITFAFSCLWDQLSTNETDNLD